jgi:thiamine-phosphate pyrophosphorylase
VTLLPDRIFVIGNVQSDEEAARLPSYAAALAAGGCRWFSVRAKTMAPAARASLVAAVRGAAPSLTLFVHGDTAHATEVAGVHLGADGSVTAARAAGARLVGISAHDHDALRSAAAAGADYATLSPIFPTPSKPGYGPALELDALRDACRSFALPIVALGGIDATNAAACLRAGAQAVAVLGAVARADDPAAAFATLRRAI